jgi:hypothetical protein
MLWKNHSTNLNTSFICSYYKVNKLKLRRKMSSKSTMLKSRLKKARKECHFENVGYALVTRKKCSFSARSFSEFLSDSYPYLGTLVYGFRSANRPQPVYTVYREINPMETEKTTNYGVCGITESYSLEEGVQFRKDLIETRSSSLAKRLCERLLLDELKGVKTFWRKR